MATRPRGSVLLDLDGPCVSEGMAYARRVLGELRALKDAGVPLPVIAAESGLSRITLWYAWKRPPRATRIDSLEAIEGACARIRAQIEQSRQNPVG